MALPLRKLAALVVNLASSSTYRVRQHLSMVQGMIPNKQCGHCYPALRIKNSDIWMCCAKNTPDILLVNVLLKEIDVLIG